MNPFRNEKQEFETAYGRYADMLYRLSFSYMKNKEDAEDVVQEVFTKYFCGLHLPMNPEQEKAWFLRVTINQCHDTLRKRGYRLHASLDEVTEVVAQEETDTGDLQDALQKLPEKNRGVVMLHYLEGYSVDEIAKILQISSSAVKMRLKRGRAFLKEELEKE
ncbi:MAG: RNA polymerase sigma factor [Agathobacter sp.]|nr:RNA polymerase sigma factor [Agathobacter sp.]MBQ3559835.1 RNA polymerase sigma factor [Agathobacter sp.]